MQSKGLLISMALGFMVGAVAILAIPHSCPARKLASKAADKVEEAAAVNTDKLQDELDK